MNIPLHIAPFWQRFVESRASDPTAHFFEAFHFDDNRSEEHTSELQSPC